MVTEHIDSASVLELLEEVKDPEIPVISVVDLGIIRDVQIENDGNKVLVSITPTYSGCPAMKVIEAEITQCLSRSGFSEVQIETVFKPAWTSDWISDKGKKALKEYGIAPPGAAASGKSAEQLVSLPQKRAKVCCPYCDSENTRLTSEFGATACKAFYFCDSCSQPFELFKAI